MMSYNQLVVNKQSGALRVRMRDGFCTLSSVLEYSRTDNCQCVGVVSGSFG